MKRALLCAVCVYALSGPAHAQWVVTDPVHTAETIARGVAEIRALEQQYQQIVRGYEAITGNRSLDRVAGALGGLSRGYLPEASAMPSLMHGNGGMFGQAQSMLDRNRLYAPSERDEAAEEMERRERITANAQALAAAGMEDAQERLARLQDLQHALENAQDPREAQVIAGMIELEKQNLALHRQQGEQISLTLAMEDRVQQQRAEQRIRRDADAVVEKTRSALQGW